MQRTVGTLSVHDLGEYDSVDISCAGDFHIGDALADTNMVREWVDWLCEEPNRFGVIPGDVLNMATRNSVSFEYGTMHPGEARELATSILAPAAKLGKIKGVVTGNHDNRGDKETGIDPLEWVCTELEIPYYSSEAVILFKVGHWKHMSRKRARSPISYSLYMSHGCKGGRKTGSKLNGVMDYREVIPNCDVYVGGHGHDPIIKPDVSYHISHTSIIQQQQMFVVCGASLDRRMGQGYAAMKAYRPLAKVFPIVTLDGTRKHISARVD